MDSERSDRDRPVVARAFAVRLDSARELKSLLGTLIIGRSRDVPEPKGVVGVAPMSIRRDGVPAPSLALGIVRKAGHDYRLAVRVQRRGLGGGTALEAIRREARGEVDVRYVGRVVKRSAASQRLRSRPVAIGASIGHFAATVGTLGCFVREIGPGAATSTMLLSNNHVLAVENRGKAGDAILQPGPSDGGRAPGDRVASLGRFVRLRKSGVNRVDAALAVLEAGVGFDPSGLAGLGGALAGLGDSTLDGGTPVGKVGRTSGVTRGRVTAFELDNVSVDYSPGNPDLGHLRFDGQVEIEGDGDAPFSQGGDSGALIVDADRRAVALLFAGGNVGGSNGRGLTYAHPIDLVLRELRVEIRFS